MALQFEILDGQRSVASSKGILETQLERFVNHGKNVLIKRMVQEIVEISCFMQTIETLVKQSEEKN